MAMRTSQRFVSLDTGLHRLSHYAHDVDNRTINSSQGLTPLKTTATARPHTCALSVSISNSRNALAACQFIATVHPQFRISQWRFLLVVAENPGLTQTEVASLLDVTLAAVSRAVDVLGSKGRKDRVSSGRKFVRAERDPADERNLQLFITPAGLSFLEQIENHLWPDQ